MTEIFMEYHLILFIPPFLLIFLHLVGTIRKKKGVGDFKYLLKFEITPKELLNMEKETTEALRDLDKVQQQIVNYKKTKKSVLIIEVIVTGYVETLIIGLISEYSSDFFKKTIVIGTVLILGIISFIDHLNNPSRM